MPTAPRRRGWRDRRLIYAVLVAAVLLTFGRVVSHEFLQWWDDDALIEQNPYVNPPTADAFAKMWTTPDEHMYIPLVYAAWWGLAQVGTTGVADADALPTLNPYVFHAANVLVHLINTLLVFAILRRLVRRDWPSACGALLFALHPLQVEPVAWATAMKDLLSSMLSLAAVWQYVVFAQAHPASPRRLRNLHYALATLAFLLALFAKPSSVVVPCIALILDVLLLRRRIKSSLLALLPWFVLAAAWSVLTANVQPATGIHAPPLWQRPIVAADSLGFYLYKFFWPARLSTDYGQRPEVILRGAWWVITAAAAVAVIASRRWWAWAAAAIAAVGLLPVLGLTPFLFQGISTVADRYVYLSMLGAALAAAFAVAAADRLPTEEAVPVDRRRRAAVVVVATLVLAALAARSFAQAGVWRDTPTLMNHALAINPTSIAAHEYFGTVLFDRNDLPGAIDNFQAAVREKPDFTRARDYLAGALARSGRTDEAIAVMRESAAQLRALRVPDRRGVAIELGRVASLLVSRGRYADAAAALREAAAASPEDAGLRRRLDEISAIAATRPTATTTATTMPSPPLPSPVPTETNRPARRRDW